MVFAALLLTHTHTHPLSFLQGLPNDLTPYMPELLGQMMNTGLSATLTEALTVLAENIPSLTPSIQIRLLDVLSVVLSNKPFRAPSTTKSKVNINR